MINPTIRTEQNKLVGLRSRKHIAPFALIRPTSVGEACAAMHELGRAAYMAGGLDLIDRMKNGEAFDRVIFLEGIPPLHGVRRTDGEIVIGALATHADIARSSELMSTVPGLPSLWREIASPRIRHTGTIGGNLMSGLPHYDAAPALLALRAKATFTDAGGSHTIAIDALGDHHGALLERIALSVAPTMHLLADRSLHPMLSIYLGASSAEGEMLTARIAVGCAYPRPLALDLPVAGRQVATIADVAPDLANMVAQALPTPIEDGLASAQYRRRMIAVLVRRILLRFGAMA
jgi:aerobic carbon-monoxide dehydrogenase medium subunit